MKLELSFKYKGQKRFFYGNTIEEVALDSYNEYFQNDEQANEYIQNDKYEDYIKDFLYGEIKFVEEIVEELERLGEDF